MAEDGRGENWFNHSYNDMSLSLLRKVDLHTPDTPDRPVEPVSWSETPDLGTQKIATDVFSFTLCFEGWQRRKLIQSQLQ